MTDRNDDRTGGQPTSPSPHNTGDRAPEITLSGVSDTLAAIPHLLGFHPTDSVVLLTGNGTSLGRTMRGDLPPEHLVDVVAVDMTAPLTDDDVSSALLVIIGGAEDGDRLPHIQLVEAVRREVAALGISDVAAYWAPEIAAGARYHCYDDSEDTGPVSDPDSSVLGAEMASRGHVTYGSRAELAALLAPDSEPRVAHRAELIEARRAASTGAWPLERRVAAVRDGLSAARRGALALPDNQIATLAIALADARVRDACLATALPPDSDRANAAAALWQELTRSLPAPERAIPACLAGYAAYMRGDGALAAIALRAALDADPDHVLAGLLDRALRHGIAPQQLHQLARHDTVGLSAGVGRLDATA